MHPVEDKLGRNITLGFWSGYPDTEFFRKRGLANKPHRGIDFAPSNYVKPIFIVAPVNGTIVAAFAHQYFGRLVVIHCLEDNTIHLLCHMDKVRYQLKKGVVIKKGEVIGTMGSTGASTARHLHYQVESERPKKYVAELPTHYWLPGWYGTFINPLKYCT
jgi:murein DD-endopeptidase MepM/ murein hydrolase activator NlpD